MLFSVSLKLFDSNMFPRGSEAVQMLEEWNKLCDKSCTVFTKQNRNCYGVKEPKNIIFLRANRIVSLEFYFFQNLNFPVMLRLCSRCLLTGRGILSIAVTTQNGQIQRPRWLFHFIIFARISCQKYLDFHGTKFPDYSWLVLRFWQLFPPRKRTQRSSTTTISAESHRLPFPYNF